MHFQLLLLSLLALQSWLVISGRTKGKLPKLLQWLGSALEVGNFFDGIQNNDSHSCIVCSPPQDHQGHRKPHYLTTRIHIVNQKETNIKRVPT